MVQLVLDMYCCCVTLWELSAVNLWRLGGLLVHGGSLETNEEIDHGAGLEG